MFSDILMHITLFAPYQKPRSHRVCFLNPQTSFDSFSLEDPDSYRRPQGLLPILFHHSSVKAATGSLNKWAMCCNKTLF